MLYILFRKKTVSTYSYGPSWIRSEVLSQICTQSLYRVAVNVRFIIVPLVRWHGARPDLPAFFWRKDAVNPISSWYRPTHSHCFVMFSMAESISVVNVANVVVTACASLQSYSGFVCGLSRKWGPHILWRGQPMAQCGPGRHVL